MTTNLNHQDLLSLRHVSLKRKAKSKMLTIDVAYLVAPWFLFIILFGNNKYLPHATILFLMAFVNILFVDVFGMVDPLTYVESKDILMWYDIMVALIMITALRIDTLAWKHALILAFAATCHFMILYDLTVYPSFVSYLFYTWYEELIIMVGLLQMAISHNGLTNALGNARELILRLSFYTWCYSKGYTSLKRSGERS